jgi:hypothetical protein
LHLVIENTGECGELTLLMESSRVLALNAEQARTYKGSYAWERAQQWNSVNKYISPDTFFGLSVVNTGDLPKKLLEGEKWDGWFESSGRPLPSDAVALIAVFGLFEEQRPKRLMNFITTDPRRPFISLTGEEVTVRPLSMAAVALAKAARFLRCIWRPATLIPFAFGISSVAVLEAATSPPVSVVLVGWFGGYTAGYLAWRLWIENRSGRFTGR